MTGSNRLVILVFGYIKDVETGFFICTSYDKDNERSVEACYNLLVFKVWFMLNVSKERASLSTFPDKRERELLTGCGVNDCLVSSKEEGHFNVQMLKNTNKNKNEVKKRNTETKNDGLTKEQSEELESLLEDQFIGHKSFPHDSL